MINWIPSTEERYDYALGVLPPASMCFGAFQVGEPMNHKDGMPTFATHKVVDGKFFESAEALTFAEFKAEFPEAEYYYGE